MNIDNMLSFAQISRQYGISNKKIHSTSKKLASGYKISQAADGGAALSISEKMRAQIRGLDQGVENAQDAYATLQVMDGRAQSANDLLQRMRELTLQAVNGTNTDQDRMLVQQEISELRDEVEYILSDVWEGADLLPPKCNLENKSIQQKLREFDFPEIAQPLWDHDKKISKDTLNILFSNLGYMQGVRDLIKKINDTPFGQEALTKEYRLEMLNDLQKYVDQVQKVQEYGGDVFNWEEIQGILQDIRDKENDSIWNWDPEIKKLSEIRENAVPGFVQETFVVIVAMTLAYDARPLIDPEERKAVGLNWLNKCFNAMEERALPKMEEYADLKDHQIIKDFMNRKYEDVYRGLYNMTHGRNYDGTLREENRYATYEMNIQVGANKGHAIKMEFSVMRLEALVGKNVLSDKAGNEMLDAIDGALKGMSDFIGAIGSYQSRLQHAMEYAMEHAEIETGAESRMRDADYGKEALENAKQNLQRQVQETLFAEEKRTKEQMNHSLYRDA